MNIRNFSYFTKIVTQFTEEEKFRFTLLISPIVNSWDALLDTQSFLSMFSVANPKRMTRIYEIYKKVKDLIENLEKKRTQKIGGKVEVVSNVKGGKSTPITEEDVLKELESIQEGLDELQLEEEEEEEHEDHEEHEIEKKEEIEEEEEEENEKSDLSKEIIEFVSKIPQSSETMKKKEEIRAMIKDILVKSSQFQGDVYIFGSSESTFGLKDSDLDICIKFQNVCYINDPKTQGQVLQSLQEAIESGKYSKDLKPVKDVINKSRVPLLKLKDESRHLECDICVDNFLGVVNSRMFKKYSQIDPRVRQLALMVKYWTKKRHIADVPTGSLSSYSYSQLVIFYLQNISPPILPSLQELARIQDIDTKYVSKPEAFNAFDCRYFTALEKLSSFWKEKQNTMTIGELLVGFFNFYTKEFFEKNTVSVRLGKSISKKQDSAIISIEDPFEKRDLGKVMLEDVAPSIIQEFERSKAILSNEDASISSLCEEVTNEGVNRFVVEKKDYPEHLPVQEAMEGVLKGKYFSGILRVNKIKFREAYVSVEGQENDILIPDFRERNRALHGDLVAIKLIESEKKTKNKVGAVVSILEKRSPKLFVCTLMEEDEKIGKHYRWLLPLEKCYPKMIMDFKNFFETRTSNLNDSIIVAEMVLPWKKHQHHAKGVCVGTLGFQKDLWAQKRGLLVQAMPHLYEHIFYKNKPLGIGSKTSMNTVTDITEFDPEEYEDWRDKDIFTIDPLTSRDLDDAVCVKHLGNDKYWVTVVVADVSKFVQTDDVNDIEARKRGTSVYMVDSVEHMLDPSLSQNVCSLLPGVNRFGVAVNWIMHENGEIEQDTVEFHRIIMKSRVKLDYDTVQEVLDGKNPKPPQIYDCKWDKIKKDCEILNMLSQALRKGRKQGGSLFLSSLELKFETNQRGYPISTVTEKHSESHQLIEELMLVANQLAAKAVYKYAPLACLLRTHEAPDQTEVIKTLNECIESYNKNIAKIPYVYEEITTKNLQESINKFFDETKQYPSLYSTLQNLLLRQMKLAKYSVPPTEGNPYHYALNVEFYTHFTSPIRRYADLIVHRLLLDSMKKIQPQLSRFKLNEIIEHINEQALKASNIQDQTTRMYLCYYLIPKLDKGPIKVESVIVSLGARSFTTFIPEFGIELKVNIMKKFAEVPDNIKDTDVTEEETVTALQSITLEWKNKRKCELKILKTVLLDIDIDYSMTPFDIYAFNVSDLK